MKSVKGEIFYQVKNPVTVQVLDEALDKDIGRAWIRIYSPINDQVDNQVWDYVRREVCK